MQKIRWVHFSDLHLGDNCAVDTRLMRRKLPEYIASLNQTFNYAFCTGDVKEWNADYSSAPDYIRSLCAASKTPLDHLFIVPGNHDIDIGDDNRAETIRKITDWKTDYYDSKVGVISETDLSVLRSGEQSFISFVENVLGTDRADRYKTPHFVIQTEHLNILHMDSVITYGKKHDREMVIGTSMLMDVLDQCDRNKPTIVLTHYSFDFLTQSERNEVENLLNTYHVQLWFAGHEHENLIRRQREEFIECQCGNLALQKGARSCFLTGELDLDTGDGEMIVHAWYEGKNWELYPFARIGSKDDRVYPFRLRLPGSESPADVSPELSNACEANAKLSLAGGLFAGVSINQTILPDLEYSGDTFFNHGNRPLAAVMHQLWMDKQKNALIIGDGGMGKSTMMYYECCELLKTRQLSVYVSLQAIESYHESIFGYILQSLYKSIDARAKDKLIRLTSTEHPHPDLVLFIDGFNELTGAGAQRYVAEIKMLSRYLGVQIIISSRLDFLRDYGLSYFGMIRACELRESQIQTLFQDRPDDWINVLAQKNLRILLKNPMMALLYASTCPVVEKHAGLDYLDWIMPIKNASDLLHDFYMSQIAILVDRESVDGNRIFNCAVAIDCLLPRLAYSAERQNTTVWEDGDFEEGLHEAIREWSPGFLSEKLRIIKRRLRVHKDAVNVDEMYDTIITEMVLLKSGNGHTSFAHQIFRDYLAAVYLHNCLQANYLVDRLWHNEEIHKGVIQYLRNIGNEATWGEQGTVSQMLQPYRGKESEDGDWFVSNVINCWLSIGDGERNLSLLDLRKVSLCDHLKTRFHGTINIDGAWISKETLFNDKHHDAIVAMRFSHDHRTLAAVSVNGIVSITNLVTQSQMIIGQLKSDRHVQIGFDADDYLIVKNSNGTYKWPTILYDKLEAGNAADIIEIVSHDEESKKRIHALQKRLKESDLQGIISVESENGRYYAVGFESGFIQVWETLTQDCVANLSLSDSQIATVSFTKDGKVAALGSGGKIVQIWNMDAGKCIDTLYFAQRVSQLRLLTDGNTLECQFADGNYYTVDLQSHETCKAPRPNTTPFVSKSLLKRLGSMQIADIQSSPGGNAIILTKKGEAYTWDERLKKLNYCQGHRNQVTTIAMCTADERFAASYSPEQYQADRDDRGRRRVLDNQKLVRVRIIKTGQCQWRLPTKGRSITKLQFFTSNRIILAGYATNGDILLWELINEQKYGKEIGHWEEVEIVRNNQAEPLECAFPDNKKDFISAYVDGSILIRPFSNSTKRKVIYTIPGIDAGVFRWEGLKCDERLKEMLGGYNCRHAPRSSLAR